MIISNEETDESKLSRARSLLLQLQEEARACIAEGSGPFLAAVYDEQGSLIAKAANRVLRAQCRDRPAEMNAIKAAQAALGTYDLSPFNLSLYVTSEPCMMCIGALIWSGIRAIYYGVPSRRVEEITGFDEGFKPHWMEEFRKRGITVYGNIEPSAGAKVLEEYVRAGRVVYRPER